MWHVAIMSCNAQKPKQWNAELYFNHPQKDNTEISPNLIEILVPYILPMGFWLGIGGSTLIVNEIRKNFMTI